MTNLVKCRFQVSRYGVEPKSLPLYQAFRWYVGCQYAGSHSVQQGCRVWDSFTSFILMFTLHAVLYFKMDPLYNYKIITRNIFCQSTPPSKYFYCIQCVRETERSPKQAIAEWRRPAGIIKPNIIQFHSSVEPPGSAKVNTIRVHYCLPLECKLHEGRNFLVHDLFPSTENMASYMVGTECLLNG